jgi:hypothetical protein
MVVCMHCMKVIAIIVSSDKDKRKGERASEREDSRTREGEREPFCLLCCV